MIALASITGSFITLLALIGSLFAVVSIARNPIEKLPTEGLWLSLAFGVYFLVLAATTALNGPDPNRFIELVLISPFVYFIPLALVLPVRCHDINLRGLGRAAMIGTVPTALLALAFSAWITGLDRPRLAPGNSNVLAALLLLQTFLCLAGWGETGKRERLISLSVATIGFVGLVIGVGSVGASLTAVILAVIFFVYWLRFQTRFVKVLSAYAFLTFIIAIAFTFLPLFWKQGLDVISKVTEPGFGDWSTSTWTRLTLYRAAVLAIADNPWVGLGQHLRYDGTLPYHAVSPPDYAYYTHMHNLLLTHGTAAGIPGILAALSLFFVTLVVSFRRAQPSAAVRWLGLTSFSSLFSLGLTETVLFHDLNTTFYMFVFVLVAVFSYQARLRDQHIRS